MIAAASSRSEVRAEPTVYEHGVVFTATVDHPDASWFVVEDGKIADVGDGELPARWRNTHRVDLGGRFVAPGFVDAHIHFVDGGLSLLQTDVADATSEAQVIDAVSRAAAHPVGGWVVIRNLGLESLGGDVPTHARMAAIVAAAGDRPLLVLLKGGHHAYASPRALVRLGIDADAKDPAFGQIVRDGSGMPTGLLVDDAAWSAMRDVASDLLPVDLARAIELAEHQALRYGITAIGDNTFDPARMAQYVRMSRAGVLHLRVSARSFGLEPGSRFTMKSQGAHLFGRLDDRIRFFGDKYFLDGALSDAGARAGTNAPAPAGPRYSVEELRQLMMFAGPFGTAYHTQSRAGAERLVEARDAIRDRRRGALPDIIDHCGRCGGGGLPERIAAAGFRITLLPGQLHELPHLLSQLPASERSTVLAFRELFAANLEPALTSDWPFGAEVSYPGVEGGLNRIGLAPMAGVAAATTGMTPAGTPIDGAASRTITMGQALLGITAYGAAAIGRTDLGRLTRGAHADFVVLPRDPFHATPAELYVLDPDETYIGGSRVWPLATAESDADLRPFASQPRGNAFAPIIGYDPIPGMLVGAAWFFYPYRARGLRGSVQLYGSPSQVTARLETELIMMRAFGRTSPRVWLRADTLGDRYYGAGMDSTPEAFDATKPRRIDALVGANHALDGHLEIGAFAAVTALRDDAASQIMARSGGAEGPIDGVALGGRLELVHDTRDNAFSTRVGGRRVLWAEAYGLQASAASFRFLGGLSVTQFVPLLAPDFVLALRGEAATSAGDKAYATDYALGGGDLLRGYYSNRFRGQHFAAGSVELRFPLFLAFTGAVFGDLGRVWVDDRAADRLLAMSTGFGLRYGLPPDRQVRLRFDVGFGRDQWGLFFKFNEAF